MRRTIVLIIGMTISFLLTAQNTDISQQLFELPDIIFTKIDAPNGYASAYELRIKQPIDHSDPSKGHFYQRAFLSHRSFDAPMVICTEGYGRPKNRPYELTDVLDGNQVDVEHRYFGASMPDSLDYEYLTLEQVTADLHYIRMLLGNIYQGPWVSTGISKGGQTTIYYRYFYPEDVAVSVPYVAPLNLTTEETRIYDFLDKVGTPECRDKLYKLQRRLLKDRQTFIPLIKWYSKGAKLDFDYLGFDKAFEYAVLEYPFSFWQWGGNCSDIPSDKAPVDMILEHFLAVSDIGFFSDRDIAGYASHYYQAADQMGYYGYRTDEFKGLLKALPEKPNPTAIFPPNKMKVEFDGTLANATYDWLKTEGDRFIYIYGELDTWSATGVPVSDQVDAHWIILKGQDHGGARIKNMTEVQRQELVNALEEWLNIDLD